MFQGPFDESIIKIAQEKGLVNINTHNLRNWSKDKHKSVDDKPYGGGPGMVLMCQPIFDAVAELRSKRSKTILLSPQGKLFNQSKAAELSQLTHLILICGHYEGVDERVQQHLVDEKLSIGDYILTGGEIPAMVVTDAVTRLIPQVLDKETITSESLTTISSNRKNGESKTLLEPPQYTRPASFRGWKVPKVLLSGNHQEIAEWRKKKAIQKTKKRRPDLLNNSQKLSNTT